MILHGYWRSSAAYRVRIALALKGVAYEQATHDLRTGAQGSADYRSLNPQALVPAFEADGDVLTQSPAILEWLEERYPSPALLPDGAGNRAIVRTMAATIACDIHPLNNLRVMRWLKDEGGLDEGRRAEWTRHWIEQGFAALEAMAGEGPFLGGDAPDLADVFLIPQMFNARRFGVALDAYPKLVAADAAASALPAFAAAHPDKVAPR